MAKSLDIYISNREYVNELYKEHGEYIRSFVMSEIAQVGEVDDIVQEVFIIAWRSIDILRNEVEKKRSWLLGVAKRVILNHRRGGLRQSALQDRLAEEYVIEEILRNSIIGKEYERFEETALYAGLKQLKDKDRKIILMRYFEDIPLLQIAKIEGIKLKTAEKRLERATDKLAEAIALWEEMYRNEK